MVSKLYIVMFSCFWLLYLSSYVGELYDDKGAQTLYAKVMVASIIVGGLLAPVTGKLVDKVNPRILLPVAFILRALTIVLFYFVSDPEGFLSFLSAILMVMMTANEMLTVDAIILRSADKEIRGTIFGLTTGLSYLGMLVTALVGGYLVDLFGAKYPFYFVGCCDTLFAIFVIIYGVCMGRIKDDVKERKMQELAMKKAMLKMKSEQEKSLDEDPLNSQTYEIN